MNRERDNQNLRTHLEPHNRNQDGNAPRDGSMIPDGYDTVDRAEPGRERHSKRSMNPMGRPIVGLYR